MRLPNISSFIRNHVTYRSESMFIDDIINNNQNLTSQIENKSILVIGGAGTIGSFFIKSILQFNPRKLYVVDTNENGLTELTRNIRSNLNITVPLDYQTYPINFGDPLFFRILNDQRDFDIIANFAAHKHVRSEKDHFSITALLENNILKAKQLLDYFSKNTPAHFFCVSTDKAANPVSIMGASKKIMEELIIAYSHKIPIKTARFANVAFSNGSLLDGFIYRLLNKQPFSVPTDIKRYFVSPEESGQICMLSCILAHTGEIFFPKLDVDKLTSFKTISESFIESLGLNVIPFDSEKEAKKYASKMSDNTKFWPVYYFSSDTSGEKEYEEFYTSDEKVDLERFISLGIIVNVPQKTILEINELTNHIKRILNEKRLSKSRLVGALSKIVPTFNHSEAGKTLDQKM